MKRRKKLGFSLGEILVAIAIMAVIAAVVIPAVGSQLRSGDEGRVQQDLTNIRSAAEQFLADVRRYPSSIGQLVRRPTTNANDAGLVGGVYSTNQVARWRGPYLNKDSVSAATSGFDAVIDYAFAVESYLSQDYLKMQVTNFDTISAINIDLRMDDGVRTTGQVQFTTAPPSSKTTLKFLAIPVQ